MLSLSDLPTLQQLGVDMARYRERGYALTQEIADAAYFLGFDGLIAPSARSECMNIMLFTDRLDAGNVSLTRSEAAPIDWRAQRPRLRK